MTNNEGDERERDPAKERERRRRGEIVCKRSRDIDMKAAEETKVENGEPIMRRVQPVQRIGKIWEISDKSSKTTKSDLGMQNGA